MVVYPGVTLVACPGCIMVYNRWYTQGVYIGVYQGGMPPLLPRVVCLPTTQDGIPRVYTSLLLCLPGYTSVYTMPTTGTTVSMLVCPLPEEEALGSNLRII